MVSHPRLCAVALIFIFCQAKIYDFTSPSVYGGAYLYSDFQIDLSAGNHLSRCKHRHAGVKIPRQTRARRRASLRE